MDEINPRYAALEKERKLVQQELNNLKNSIDTHKVATPKQITQDLSNGKLVFGKKCT